MTKEEMKAEIKSRSREFYAEQLKLRYEGERPLCKQCALIVLDMEEIKDECPDCIAYKLAYYEYDKGWKREFLAANYGLYLDSPDRPFIPPKKTDRPRMTPEEMIEDIKGRHHDEEGYYTSHWDENDEQLCRNCRLTYTTTETAKENFREECPDCLLYKQMGMGYYPLQIKDILIPVTWPVNLN
jgi:hypothetical protein